MLVRGIVAEHRVDHVVGGDLAFIPRRPAQ